MPSYCLLKVLECPSVCILLCVIESIFFSSASLSFSGSERDTIAVSLFWRSSTVVMRTSVLRSSIAAAIFLPFLFLFQLTWLDVPSPSQEVA